MFLTFLWGSKHLKKKEKLKSQKVKSFYKKGSDQGGGEDNTASEQKICNLQSHSKASSRMTPELWTPKQIFFFTPFLSCVKNVKIEFL